MSLIERLRDWGESLFTSKKAFVAHQALPQGNSGRVTVQLQNVDGWTYTPPEDGYLAADIYSADQVFLHSGVLSYLDAGDRKGIYLPVRKGENVSVGSANHSSSSSLYFFPLIGGGYLSSVLQAIGGCLCLISHSFNRFSSSAVAKQCQRLNALTLAFRKTDKPSTTLPRLMGTSAPVLLTQREGQSFKPKQLEINCYRLLTSELTNLLEACSYPLKKVTRLQSLCDTTLQGIQQRLFSYQPSARLNPCFEGGAL